MRRIIGKAIIAEIKPDLVESAGCLQLCAGQKSGCEAAAHAMADIFAEEQNDAILLIDASNAFNSLNREALLHNIQYICPPISTYVRNCYGTPSRLFIAGGRELKSAEGTTQGDPGAMPSYGMGILPFLGSLKPEIDPKKMKHVAYADDLGGGARLEMLKVWWEKIEKNGPAFGYYPKASKSWLIVKENELNKAKEIFAGTGINITTEGRKYLGGFIGTREGTESYIQELVDDWMEQLKQLTQIANSEPQAAYAAFTAGFKHKLTYYLRTIPNISNILRPIDDYIDNELIPAFTEGHICSERDRKLLALPVRLGGLGIPVFAKLAEMEYNNSRRATQNLASKIIAQDEHYTINQQQQQQREIERNITTNKNEQYQQDLENIRRNMSKEELRANDLAQLKGGSSWLTSLPLKEEGFVLNKREFFDAVTIRYRWQLKRLPLNCACGKPFEMNHAMTCMKGGFIHRRHDQIRDIFAKLLDEVAWDVRIEPPLQPLTGEALLASANQEDEARLDVAARGFWQQGEMAFFDIRVFNPFAKSHLNVSLETAFKNNERTKKNAYNNRVIRIEHGSFTPIVLSAMGGCGKETSRFISKLIEMLGEKKEILTSTMASYIRTKLSFNLVRSQVMCIRGSRTLYTKIDTENIEVTPYQISE